MLSSLLDDARRVLATDGVLLLVHHRDLDLRPHLRRYSAVRNRATGDEHVVVAARR